MKKYIAVDFDGTLCVNKFPKCGESLRKHQRIADWLIDKQSIGWIIILWTCRENIPEGNYLNHAIQYCKDTYDLRFDYINENPERDFGHSEKVRKIWADLYIDDKALNVEDI